VTRAAALERLAAMPERFPDALLLSGASEAALEAVAKALAMALLCPGGDPSHRCESCRRAGAGLHPDLCRVEPEGVQIKVERVREALAFGAGRPYEAARRVILVTRAEMLGLEAANALLKSLEEPGARLRWILTTTRPEALLATIRSRCVAVALPRSGPAGRTALLRERGLSAEDAADLAQLVTDDEPAPDLAGLRELRARIAAALEAGLCERRLPALLLLAEQAAARGQVAGARLTAELLADAALAGSGAGDFVRHRALAGKLTEIARRVPPAALRRAALAAADAPPDTRRGNKRLHFEQLLLDLYLSGF
jgi:DNA polymerase III delta subunit-like protein